VSGVKKVNKLYPKLLNKLTLLFKPFQNVEKIIFFEYLDNSIGYWLKKNKVVGSYINDIHGIASNEFIFQRKKAKSLTSKGIFKNKELVYRKLDRKVFNNASGIFYASEAMIDYFSKIYPSLNSKKNFYLPYVLNSRNIKPVDFQLVEKFKREL